MALNEMNEMLVGGLPEGVKAVHKHGYVPDTHGDVAAIWGPAGPYVISVFLYRPTWLEWGIPTRPSRKSPRQPGTFLTSTAPDSNETQKRHGEAKLVLSVSLWFALSVACALRFGCSRRFGRRGFGRRFGHGRGLI